MCMCGENILLRSYSESSGCMSEGLFRWDRISSVVSVFLIILNGFRLLKSAFLNIYDVLMGAKRGEGDCLENV